LIGAGARVLESILPRLEFQHEKNPAFHDSPIRAPETRRRAFAALNHQSISVARARQAGCRRLVVKPKQIFPR
jgi:hypothetical protein